MTRDQESRRLDRAVLTFIRRYHRAPSPEMAFEILALRLFRHQFARNRPYRRFCFLEKKIPSSVKGWRDIPALPTLAFKHMRVTSFGRGRLRREFRTSGTTRPETGRHFFDSLRLYAMSILPPFQERFLSDSPRLSYYFLMESSRSAPYSSLAFMMDIIRRYFARSRGKFYLKGSRANFVRLVRDLRKEKEKVFLLTTAFSLKAFLDHLRSRKIRLRLKHGSRLMETGGFKGHVEEVSKGRLYALCEKYLGIPQVRCVSEYGMTELSSQMYAARDGCFQGPAWLKSLVIDPESGREAKVGGVGLLRHIDLANRGSVIAVQTEDLGRRGREGFQLLGRARGAALRGCSLRHESLLGATV